MKRKVKRNSLCVFMLFFSILFSGVYLNVVPLFAKEGNVYKSLDIMCDVISIIQRDYIEKMNSRKLIDGALKGMLRSLDGYSYYVPADSRKGKPEGEPEAEVLGTYGLEVAYKERILTVIAPVEGGPAWKVGLKPGDMIIKIDEEPVGKSSLAELIQLFHTRVKEQIQLTVVRRGARDFLEFTLKPGKIEGPEARFEMQEDKIGLLKITRFDKGTLNRVTGCLGELNKEGAENLIVDLRGCAGGKLEDAIAVADLFLPSGELIASLKGRAEGVSKEFRSKGEPVPHGSGPIVVLMNEGTSGAAELLAGAIRDSHMGVLMGQKSFGVAYSEGSFELRDGSLVKMITGVYVTPAGRVIQNKGIEVDIPVEVPPIAEEGEKTEEKGEKPEKKTEESEEELDPVVQSAIDLIKGIRIIKEAEKE